MCVITYYELLYYGLCTVLRLPSMNLSVVLVWPSSLAGICDGVESQIKNHRTVHKKQN